MWAGHTGSALLTSLQANCTNTMVIVDRIRRDRGIGKGVMPVALPEQWQAPETPLHAPTKSEVETEIDPC